MTLSNTEYRVISVTPAGREKYLRILVPYLLQNRHLISEHHFWLNTNNASDIRYIESLAHHYPDFFKINRKELFSKHSHFDSIWQYFQDYTDENTLYIRLDDDICFIAPDAIPALINYRIDNPCPFLVYGNIVNNAICSHILQLRGTIPSGWGKVLYECMDPAGWKSPKFAERLHKRFLSDLRRNRLERWKFENWIIDDCRRFSVNVISWFGKDMKPVEELGCRDLRKSGITDPSTGGPLEIEESLISAILPRRFSRPCEICGDALFAHFAFYTQRPYLEGATTLLERYQSFALNNNSLLRNLRFSCSGLFKKFRYVFSVQKIRILDTRIHSWFRKLNLNARYKTFIMIKSPGFYSVLRTLKRTLLSLGTGSKKI
jgi:hypothetical protein